MKLRYTAVWLIIGLMGVSLVSCTEPSAATPATHTTDSLETVQQKIAGGEAVLVDVREQGEWDEGHIVGAILLPISDLKQGLDAATLAKRLPKGKVIYTHCRAGHRAVTACDLLQSFGYDLRPLGSGYQELVDAGFEKAQD